MERTLQALASAHPPSTSGILPRVSIVRFAVPSTVAMIGLLQILGREISFLQIPGSELECSTSLPYTESLASMPSSLRLVDGWAHAPHLCLSLTQCSNTLRELHLQGVALGHEHFETIARLPRLARLGITCLPLDEMEGVDAPPTEWCFRSLKVLVLDSQNDLSECTAFLVKFRPVLLAKVRIEDHMPVLSPEDLHAFCVSLSTPELSQTIEDLSFQLAMESSSAVHAFTLAELEPLLALQRLTSLWMSFDDHGKFRDAGFKVIARSWPMLRDLCVNWFSGSEPVLTTTQAIVNLARHPRLEMFRIDFDPSVIVPTTDVVNTRIQYFQMPDSRLDPQDIPAMADFLLKLLPTVARTGVTLIGWDSVIPSWNELNEYLEAYATWEDRSQI